MGWLLHKRRACPFIFNAGEVPLCAGKRADGPLMEGSGLVDGWAFFCSSTMQVIHQQCHQHE